MQSVLRSSLARSIVAGVLLLAMAAPTVFADQEWCSDDPPRVLTSPNGNQVLVYVTLAAPGNQYVADLTQGLVNTTSSATHATRNGTAGTIFSLISHVPNDPLLGSFAVRGYTSSLPFANGTIYVTSTGTSGAPLVMTFWYPIQ